MAKFQNAYRENLEQEEAEIEQHYKGEQEPNEAPVDAEDERWKKRYSDLRSYSAKKENEFKKRLEDLEGKLNSTAAETQYPKTEAEVATWMESYPHIGGIVKTIVLKELNQKTGKDKAKPADDKVRKLEIKIAMRELRDRHPDFDTLRATEAFKDWVADIKDSAPWAFDALYGDDYDSDAAIEAMDLFKDSKFYKKGIRKPAGAAESVGNRGQSAPGETGSSKWTESSVERLSDAEYEKNEPEIMKAMLNPAFYDKSGAAR